MIDIKDFLANYSYKTELEDLINVSNLALKNWNINWTKFLDLYIYDEIHENLKTLSDLSFFVYGGYENSDRVRVACFRTSISPSKTELLRSFPGIGIDIKGNFLFDNANQTDFRDFIRDRNVAGNEIGDLWTIRDKGAQGIIAKNTLNLVDQKNYFLRDVETKVKLIELEELKTPLKRSEKFINTVEASTRIDAIASAGFRISRNKICERIKEGLLSLNGKKVNKSTISLVVGDKIMLENRGLVEILEIEITKRERWKIKLIKK